MKPCSSSSSGNSMGGSPASFTQAGAAALAAACSYSAEGRVDPDPHLRLLGFLSRTGAGQQSQRQRESGQGHHSGSWGL